MTQGKNGRATVREVYDLIRQTEDKADERHAELLEKLGVVATDTRVNTEHRKSQVWWNRAIGVAVIGDLLARLLK